VWRCVCSRVRVVRLGLLKSNVVHAVAGIPCIAPMSHILHADVVWREERGVWLGGGAGIGVKGIERIVF
jgi:hypothetical protein